MGRTRYRFFETEYPYFLTWSIVGWLPVFTRPTAVQMVFDSWKYLQEKENLRIFGYVIMENHLHFIASTPELPKVVARSKFYIARQIIDRLLSVGDEMLLAQLQHHKATHKTNREFQLWQEGSHPQQIQSDEMLLQKMEYMHNNPVSRGYVNDPVHWRYSSARNYAGLPGLLDVVKDWH